MLDEDMLLRGLRDRDAGAMRDFVTQYQGRVYNTTLSLVKDEADAEELTQDVMVAVWHSIDSFRGESALSTWVYRIAITKSLDLIRSRTRRKRFGFILSTSTDKEEINTHAVNWVHPGIIAENREKAAYLFRAINALPKNQKVAFTLSKMEQLSQREIAEVMNIKEGAVESLLHRARQNLKKALEDIYEEWK